MNWVPPLGEPAHLPEFHACGLNRGWRPGGFTKRLLRRWFA